MSCIYLHRGHSITELIVCQRKVVEIGLWTCNYHQLSLSLSFYVAHQMDYTFLSMTTYTIIINWKSFSNRRSRAPEDNKTAALKSNDARNFFMADDRIVVAA